MFICLPDKTCWLNKIFMPVFSWLYFTWHSSKWPISWVKYDTILLILVTSDWKVICMTCKKKDFNNHELILKEKIARIWMHYVFVSLKTTDICSTPIKLWLSHVSNHHINKRNVNKTNSTVVKIYIKSCAILQFITERCFKLFALSKPRVFFLGGYCNLLRKN